MSFIATLAHSNVTLIVCPFYVIFTQVRARQLNLIQEQVMKLQKVRLVRSQFQPEDVTLYCKKCGHFACQAHDFRLLRETYYVVVTQDIYERITVKPHPSPWKRGVALNEKVYCAECGEDWGVMVTAMEVTLPSLKIVSFVLQMSDGTKRSIKKWSKRPFEVAEAEFSDFFQMNENL